MARIQKLAHPSRLNSNDSTAGRDIELDVNNCIKNAIAQEIMNYMKARHLTQKQVAEIIGTNQAKVSNVTRGRLSGFGTGRLINFLVRLGYDVDIHISKSPTDLGRATIHSPGRPGSSCSSGVRSSEEC